MGIYEMYNTLDSINKFNYYAPAILIYRCVALGHES
jgi:hypothetical protein